MEKKGGILARIGKMGENSKLLLLSLAVGICAGLAAVTLQTLVHLVQHWISPLMSGSDTVNWEYFFLPGIGMLLSLLLIRYFIKDNIGHGVTKVLVAISRNESRIKPHNMWSSVLTSVLTIGFGGSVGAEAPIVYTGAAFGSNIGRKFGLSHRSITILVGCGAAGAVAGIFKAPLAGVLFTLEILLFNISMASMTPLLVSTVSSTVVAYMLTGSTTPFQCNLDPFSIERLPFYIVLGVFCGLCSWYFQGMTLWLEDKFSKMRSAWLKWMLCAIGVGALLVLFPPLFGEGYDTLTILLKGGLPDMTDQTPAAFLMHNVWGIPLFFAVILLLKVVSMTLTNAGGGVGGTFGPTLVVGGLAGFVFVRTLNLAFTGVTLPEQNFVLVGMAGLMAGVMQAPMTAIFLIAEITGGYELFLPLILCATVSYGTTRLREKFSIYTKRIAASGDLLTHDNDQAVMTLLQTKDLIRDKYPRVNYNATFREVVDIVTRSTAAVFPVVDGMDKFQGLIEMDTIRKHLLQQDQYDRLKAYNLMQDPQEYIYEEEKMESVMGKFEKTDAWRLPVIKEDGSYLGFISKSRILLAYREKVRELSQD